MKSAGEIILLKSDCPLYNRQKKESPVLSFSGIDHVF